MDFQSNGTEDYTVVTFSKFIDPNSFVLTGNSINTAGSLQLYRLT